MSEVTVKVDQKGRTVIPSNIRKKFNIKNVVKLIVKDIIAFYDILSELKYRRIGTFSTRPEYHREAFKLREKYKFLTYFDSLHAAVGMIENLEMVSYDGRYAEIIELKYSNPDNLYTSR